MRTSLRAVAYDVSEYTAILLPAALLLTTSLSISYTPTRHSLLLSSISWAITCVYISFQAGVRAAQGDVRRRQLSWIGGCCHGFAEVCERAACDRDGIWWTKVARTQSHAWNIADTADQPLLIVAVYILLKANLGPGATPSSSTDSESSSDKQWPGGANRLVAIAAVSAAMVLYTPSVTSQVTILGLCGVLSLAFALIALSNAFVRPSDDKYGTSGGFMSANGSLSRRASMSVTEQDTHTAILRDFSMAVVLVSAVGACSFEGFRFNGTTHRMRLVNADLIQDLAMIAIGVIRGLSMAVVVS